MNNKYYITTAIDYINGKPHIGHSYEKVAADVLARFHRAQGADTRFLTGTDEHGAKIEKFAEDQGVAIEQFASEAASGFKLAWDNLNVSYDRFIRTTDEDHIKVVEEIITKIKDNGFLYEADYEGLYCVGHEAFITEKDLVDGLCPEHKKAPETIKETNWFFKVSSFTETIKDKIESGEFKIYPEHSKKEILAMLEEGFTDLAATRPNVKWGIPVPWDKEQTIYVWVDALINYVTGAKTSDQYFWPADVHVIGPDIAKFHCIIWPALLLAADLPLPKSVAIHGFLTLNHEKISKSTGNIIDPNDWVEKFGADAVRYFLLREVPFDAHGDVSEEKLRARYEGDLANKLGNLVSRVTTLIEKFNDQNSSEDKIVLDMNVPPILDLDKKFLPDQRILEYKFHIALQDIFAPIELANAEIDNNKYWELIRTDPVLFINLSKILLSTIHQVAQKLLPFIPETAQKILDIVTAEKITKAEPLFPRID